jgi:septal ring factor EnvC (AmiA/AmiB activator)
MSHVLPNPNHAATLLAFPDTAERRLRRALHALDTALDEQRAAVAGFRGQLAELRDAVGGLGASAGELRSQIDEAAAEVAAASRAAQDLHAAAAMMDALARR